MKRAELRRRWQRRRQPKPCPPWKNRQRLLHKRGLNDTSFFAMLLLQEGRCLICLKLIFKQSEIAIDHCHVTGRVRGLLCHGCNTGLGAFRDNIGSLIRAAIYLSPEAELENLPNGDQLKHLRAIASAQNTTESAPKTKARRKKRKRGSISVSGEIYTRLRAAISGRSLSKFIEDVVHSTLDDSALLDQLLARCSVTTSR